MARVRAQLAAMVIIAVILSMAILYERPLFRISKTKIIMIHDRVMDDIYRDDHLTEKSESRGRNIHLNIHQYSSLQGDGNF